MNVNIIATGKLKEDYLRAACAEYGKRLSTFCRFSVIELPESRLGDDPSDKEIARALEAEAEQIRSKLTNGSYSIAMCIEGKQIASEELAELLERVPTEGKSTLNIIIGSSYGIAESLKKQADMRLSMSKMTFPHQLARVMVMEQVYRGFMINSGKKYHK
ncbi:MAG: 23S rRNA (pseudouridine(1915)-N(3))-methyltransferase RlmH [Oscillospiraceae bacterium]